MAYFSFTGSRRQSLLLGGTELAAMDRDPFQPLISDFSRWLQMRKPTVHYLTLVLLDFGIYGDSFSNKLIDSYREESLESTLRKSMKSVLQGPKPSQAEITARFFYKIHAEDNKLCRQLMQRIYNDAEGAADEELEQYPLLQHLDEGIADNEPEISEIVPRVESMHWDDEVEIYSELKSHVSKVNDEVLFVDPYIDEELVELYIHNLPESVRIRILTNNVKGNFRNVAKKHLKRKNQEFAVKLSSKLHDRMVFVDDDKCMIVGSSLKDAGWKPTYLVEISSVDLFKETYENI